MQMQRRTFLKGTAAVGVGLAFFDLSEARAEMRELKIARHHRDAQHLPLLRRLVRRRSSTRSDDKAKNVTPSVVHVEGDPDHPINRGTLCPKGTHASRRHQQPQAARQVPKVRRPGSDRWEEISWDEAIGKIARHIKDTRDRTFVAKNARGQVVNRTPGIAVIGGCTDTNEFNFLQDKFMEALGVVYRDSQARV